MRVLVLALAILLLPLRGWLGEAMGTAMAVEAVQSVAAAHATHTTTADGHAMHDIAGMAHDLHAPQDAQASPDCGASCGNCQLCHTVAMTSWPELAPPLAPPRAAPSFVPAAFASVEPAPGLKPPIS